jgi:hypothetical protein
MPEEYAPWIHWDPVGMEYALEDADASQRSQLVVLRLETVAQIYRLLAESAAQAAQIHGQGGGD